MTTRPAPACFECVHFRGRTEAGPTCEAFPGGIPDDIYFGGVDHRRPYPGDRGVRWEPAEGVPGYPPVLEVVDPNL